MRIAHVTTIPVTLGFLRGLIPFLGSKGFDIHVVSAPGKELDAFAESTGVVPHGIQMARRITPMGDIVAILRLARILRASGVQIVHSHTPKGGFVAMLAAFLARCPIRIHHFHGSPYMAARGWRRTVLKTVERVSCALANRVICVSPSLKEQAVRDGLCSREKIVVFGAGSVAGIDAQRKFNPERFDESDKAILKRNLGIPVNAPVIGYVGRIVRDKGVHELSSAWAALRPAFPHSHLVLVGRIEPGDPVDPVTLNQLKADPRVHLVGAVDDPTEYYSIFDVLALPSYREGFGNVNMEAAAMGIPVVSTLIPGCIDSVKNGVTGTLVPPRDAGALRDAIQQYLKDPKLRRKHGLAGRRRILEEFQQEDIWNAIYDEYRRQLESHGLPVPLASKPVSN